MHALSYEQRDRVDSLQRRAIKLISNSHDYELYCVIYDTGPVAVRLDNLAQQFFHKICDSNDCIKYIVYKRLIELLNRLRHANNLTI